MPCANCRRVLTALPNEDGNISGGDHCSIFLVRNSESEEACAGQQESIEDVSISDAISTVFEASLKLHKKLVPPDCRLLMCFQCLSALTTLNMAYKKFMTLTVEGSYVQTLLETSILWSSFVTHSDDPFQDLAPVHVKLESAEVEVNFPIIKEEDVPFSIELDPLSDPLLPGGEVLLRRETRKLRTSKLKGIKRSTARKIKKAPSSIRISTDSTSASTKVIEETTDRHIQDSTLCQSSVASSLTIEDPSEESSQNSHQPNMTAEPLVCPHKCETSFSSEEKFRKHMISVHDEKPTFKCEVCGKIYPRRARYRWHLKYKHGQGLTAKDLVGRCCSVCDKTFETKSRLRLHQVTVHGTEKPFECEVEGCGRRFPTKNYLDIHRQKRHASEDERCPCEFCGKWLCDKRTLQVHIKTVHEGIRDVICEICGKAFASKSELKKHITTHDKTRQKSFECNVCNKMFMSTRSLRSHVVKHSGVKSELCSYCGDSFFEAMSLRRHLAAKHGVRPTTGFYAKERHECALCGKVFKLKDYLNQHMMSKMHGGKGRIAPKKKATDDA